MATSYYFWGTSKSEFAKREEKNSLLMHALIPAMFSQSIDACPYSCRVFSLLFTTFFLSFFLSTLFTLSFLLLCCRGLFPLGSFLFLGSSLWVPAPLSASPFHPWLPLPFIVNRFNEISLFYP